MNPFPDGAFVLTVPVPPSSNVYWRTRVIAPRKGKPFVSTYVSAEAQKYKILTKNTAIAAGMKPIPKPAEVVFYAVWYRARRSGDLKNRNKVLEDALEGAAYENDSQIAEAHWWRSDADPGNPRVEFCVLSKDDVQEARPLSHSAQLMEI